MSLSALVRTSPGLGFPRVSGDEPGDYSGPIFGLEFSPRERG